MQKGYENFVNHLGGEKGGQILRLNDDQIDAAYRIQEFKFRVEDAKRHAKEYAGIFDRQDYEDIASEFLNKYDCNIPENSQFEFIIENAAKAKIKAIAAGASMPEKSDPDVSGLPQGGYDNFTSNLSPEDAKAVLSLDDRQLEAAYRIQEFKFRVEDAKTHAEGSYPGLFDRDDFEEMAQAFLDEYDCNIDENDLWDTIVEDAASGKEEISVEHAAKLMVAAMKESIGSEVERVSIEEMSPEAFSLRDNPGDGEMTARVYCGLDTASKLDILPNDARSELAEKFKIQDYQCWRDFREYCKDNGIQCSTKKDRDSISEKYNEFRDNWFGDRGYGFMWEIEGKITKHGISVAISYNMEGEVFPETSMRHLYTPGVSMAEFEKMAGEIKKDPRVFEKWADEEVCRMEALAKCHDDNKNRKAPRQR